MIHLLPLLLGCGQPEAAPDAASPTEPAGAITADQVLQRHIDSTNQCALLTAETYVLEWETVVSDRQRVAKTERVRQQGRQGTSFARLHQQQQPTQRFTAFGLTTDGSWWSAGDLGVKKDLPPDVARPLMVSLDPTPVCAFQKRWPTREYLGQVEHNEVWSNHVRGTYADGTSVDLWFATEDGRLIGSVIDIGDVRSEMMYTKYAEHNGIVWPERVLSSRSEGGIDIFIAEKLVKLELDGDGFNDIGPVEVAAAIAAERQAALGEDAPPSP